jgi:hypothetical protein
MWTSIDTHAPQQKHDVQAMRINVEGSRVCSRAVFDTVVSWCARYSAIPNKPGEEVRRVKGVIHTS